jgi:hypothetical protein
VPVVVLVTEEVVVAVGRVAVAVALSVLVAVVVSVITAVLVAVAVSAGTQARIDSQALPSAQRPDTGHRLAMVV